MNSIDIINEQHWYWPWTLSFTMRNIDNDHEKHWHLPWTLVLPWITLTFTMNNIDIYHAHWYFHEKHIHLPWPILSFTMNIDICHEQHWYLPWTTLTFAINNSGIYREHRVRLPWATFTFTMNNIDICHEQADVYNTWRKNLILKTTKDYCKIPLSGFVSIISKLRSSLFWDLRQRRTVVTDVSVRLQRLSDLGVYLEALTLEGWTDRLSWNVGK